MPLSVLHSHFLSGLCCLQASHSASHVWEVTGGPKPGHAGFCPRLPALQPLLGRLVAWSCAFSRSHRSLLPLPGFCFNLSVAEMQSTQRAYFYQRFPILHVEPGDWPPEWRPLCVVHPGLWQMLLLRHPACWLSCLTAPPWSARPCGKAPPIAGPWERTSQIRRPHVTDLKGQNVV